jgi:N-acetylglucosaminyldiphosphoundecaprenol N-acetyl-beta-D-mannosaminyltransferase
MKIDILGVKIDNLTMAEALEKIQDFLKDEKQHYIVLPYSEFIVRAQKDEEFLKILNGADLSLCESRGLQLIVKFSGKEIKENIYGVELIYNLSQKLFLFGGKEDVVKKAAEKLGDAVVGHEHGYQNLDKVIEKINLTKPEILLVGLGSPKQEKWIYDNLKKMPSVKVAIGVGGAFDFISGKIKRAPQFLQKIGLEWLWRLILQPRRIARIFKGVGGLSLLIIKNKKCNL